MIIIAIGIILRKSQSQQSEQRNARPPPKDIDVDALEENAEEGLPSKEAGQVLQGKRISQGDQRWWAQRWWALFSGAKKSFEDPSKEKRASLRSTGGKGRQDEKRTSCASMALDDSLDLFELGPVAAAEKSAKMDQAGEAAEAGAFEDAYCHDGKGGKSTQPRRDSTSSASAVPMRKRPVPDPPTDGVGAPIGEDFAKRTSAFSPVRKSQVAEVTSL